MPMSGAPAELFTDRVEPNAIRVEFTDDDGGCEVTVFYGPRALERAETFAKAFYGTFNDPDGLCGTSG